MLLTDNTEYGFGYMCEYNIFNINRMTDYELLTIFHLVDGRNFKHC